MVQFLVCSRATGVEANGHSEPSPLEANPGSSDFQVATLPSREVKLRVYKYVTDSQKETATPSLLAVMSEG